MNKIFESIFTQHYQSLCSYAYTFLKDEDSSEDIVQELFVKIWEKQKMQIATDQIKFYLFRAVRNNCLTLLKKNKRNHFRELKEEDASYEIKIPIDSKREEADPKDLISKALEQLPPRCREVFMLSRLSGQTYQEIADTLEISKKTVENQMGKAIKMMKVFAKNNGIYVVILYFIFLTKYILQIIGVFMDNWFY